MRMRRWPSKWNGLVTTPTVRMPTSRRRAGDDRRGAGAGAAAHAGGDEHHVRAREMIADFVDHLLGGGAADIGLRAGAEALGDLHAHLDDALGLRHGERLRVGVGDDEVDALEAGRDHVVDGIAAGAADAEHGDPRLELTDVGDFQIDGHVCLFFPARASSTPGPGRSATGRCDVLAAKLVASEALAKPSSDPGEIAARACHQVPRRRAFEVFEMRRLRVDQQARRGREGRALGRVRQPAMPSGRPMRTGRPKMRARKFRQVR